MNISAVDQASQETSVRHILLGGILLRDCHGHTSEVHLMCQPILVADKNEVCINAAKSNSRMRMHLYGAVADFLKDLDPEELLRLTGRRQVPRDDVGMTQRAVFELTHGELHDMIKARFYIIHQDTGEIDQTPHEIGGFDEFGCVIRPNEK